MIKTFYMAVLGFSLACALPVQAAVVFDDKFTDGERSTNNPPDSVAWYTQYDASKLKVVSNALSVNGGAGGNMFLGYFPSVALNNVGDSLTLSFSFSASAITDSAIGLRIGLFNSGGSQISADNQGGSNATYLNYAGYQAYTNMGSAASGQTSIRKRNAGVGGELMTGANWTGYTGTSVAGANLSSDIPYTGTLTVLREAGDVKLTISLNGVTTSIVDATGVTSFDTLAFSLNSNAASSMTFTEISISTVPEPSSVSLLLLSGAGLGLLYFRSSLTGNLGGR